MKCPYCGCEESKVVDSRPTDEGERIRRRRECLSCAKRFTTYEIIETTPVMVVKRDNSREPFNRQKLTKGILRACEKRPISLDQIDGIVDLVETKIQNKLDREIPSELIGEYTMEALKGVDEVAYIRFACVYRQFQDINTFMEELKRLMNEQELNN